MSDGEVAAFLAEQRTVVCATGGPRGWPHLMPLWYVLREPAGDDPAPQLWAWTYAASQKARNLQRDPRATLQVEAGERYDQLRGVMLETETVLHHETEVVSALGEEIFARYAMPAGEPPAPELAPEVREMVARQAPKRVAMQFRERRRSSWDHRKLGGAY
jgi:hypothetical protein